MVDIKAAVANAIEFAMTSLGRERTAGIRLEELESSNVEGEPVWLITLSIVLNGDGVLGPVRAAAASIGADTAREYKTFTVAKSSGEVLSMKMRVFATPIAS